MSARTSAPPVSLAWLEDVLKPLALAPPVAAIVEPVEAGAPGIPDFEYWPGPASPARVECGPGWEQRLGAAVCGAPGAVLVNALPSRGFETRLADARFRDAAAVVVAALGAVRPGEAVVALVPTSLLVQDQGRAARAAIARHTVEWQIDLGEEASRLASLPPVARVSLLVVRAGAAPGPGAALRVADLRSVPRGEWAPRLEHARRRPGGEVGPTIVVGEPRLGEEPWTFERLTKDSTTSQQDLAEAGRLVPLSEVAWVRPGIVSKQIERRPAPGRGAWIPCYGAASLDGSGRLLDPVAWVRTADVAAEAHLRPGDLLVARVARGAALDVAEAGRSEGTFDRDLVRVRWRDDVAPDRRRLLADYLRSPHALKWLRTHGAGVTAPLLAELEVPEPHAHVVEALDELERIADMYAGWASAVRGQATQLFAGSALRETVAELQARRDAEKERLDVALLSGTLEFMVCQRFPHPLALRFESLSRLDDGTEKLDLVLEAAEYLTTLVGWLGLVQERPSLPAGELPGAARKYLVDEARQMNWGKAASLIEGAVSFTRKQAAPLSLPVPGLNRFVSAGAEWTPAESALRNLRNDIAHLKRPSEHDAPAVCAKAVDDLRAMCRAAGFLARTPLCWVEDYARRPGGTRQAILRLLQGVSPAHPRQTRVVQDELTRGDVGVFDEAGRFWSLDPWVRRLQCRECRGWELFSFSSLPQSGQHVTYVAMATGHQLDVEDEGARVATLLKKRK